MFNKKITIFLVIINCVLYSHEERVHQYITNEAFKLLKNRFQNYIPFLSTLENHMANTGKYFTEVIFEASDANQLSNQMTLYTRIKTKRGSLEALWELDFITFGIQEVYTSNDTNISALWGE